MSGGSGRPVSLRRGKKRQLDEAEIRNLTLHEDNEEVVQGEIQGEIQEVDLRYVQLLFFVVMNVFFLELFWKSVQTKAVVLRMKVNSNTEKTKTCHNLFWQ